MKILRLVLVLISLFATAVPCVHAEDIEHHEAHDGLSVSECCSSHVCADTPCSKPGQFVRISDNLIVKCPPPAVLPTTVYLPVQTVVPKPVYFRGEQHRLQTVQLLI